MRQRQVTVYLPDDVVERLMGEATRAARPLERVTLAGLVRELVGEALEARRKRRVPRDGRAAR
jgi:hypothetical protein